MAWGLEDIDYIRLNYGTVFCCGLRSSVRNAALALLAKKKITPKNGLGNLGIPSCDTYLLTYIYVPASSASPRVLRSPPLHTFHSPLDYLASNGMAMFPESKRPRLNFVPNIVRSRPSTTTDKSSLLIKPLFAAIPSLRQLLHSRNASAYVSRDWLTVSLANV